LPEWIQWKGRGGRSEKKRGDPEVEPEKGEGDGHTFSLSKHVEKLAINIEPYKSRESPATARSQGKNLKGEKNKKMRAAGKSGASEARNRMVLHRGGKFTSTQSEARVRIPDAATPTPCPNQAQVRRQGGGWEN